MKILYLVHPENDYGESFLYNGLTTLLGEDNVILYPQKLSYMGFSDSSYILWRENKRGFTNPAGHTIPRRLRIYPLEEIIDLMPEFDFILLSSPRHYAVHALRFIKRIYGNKIPHPLVYTDFEDGATLCTDIIEEFKPTVVFKRELIEPIGGIYPLPFSSAVPYLIEKFDDQNKTLDLFCTFGFTHQLRKQVIDFLIESKFTDRQYLALDIPDLIREGRYNPLLSYQEYLKAIASSKVAISVRGHGRDTVRYWEIPSFETLFLVSDPGIIIPHPFEDGKNCVQFFALDDLAEKIKYYLSHDEERIKIAKAGKEHLLKYHTNSKRAEYFISIVKKELMLN